MLAFLHGYLIIFIELYFLCIEVQRNIKRGVSSSKDE